MRSPIAQGLATFGATMCALLDPLEAPQECASVLNRNGSAISYSNDSAAILGNADARLTALPMVAPFAASTIIVVPIEGNWSTSAVDTLVTVGVCLWLLPVAMIMLNRIYRHIFVPDSRRLAIDNNDSTSP